MAEPDTHFTTHSSQPVTPPVYRRPPHRKIPTPVMVLVFVFVAGLGYLAGALNHGSLSVRSLVGGKELDLSSLQSTYQALSDNFDGELDEQALIDGANKGLVDAAGDQYTVFMNSKDSQEFDDALSGNIGGGIGVEVGIRNNVPTVVRVLKDNPAEKAGLTVGDIVIKVNGEDTAGLSLNEVVAKIRGEVDTTVKLTVLRDSAEKEFSITRAQVSNPSAYGEVRGTVGILTITRFDDNTASLARSTAKEFKEQGVTRVVLDLRGNGGGYVTAAQAVAGIWLDNELVTTERRGGQVTDELTSTGTPLLGSLPTVVLVNASSASASEIVAGALRDHKAATLLGETTFGKGSVQKLINLPHDAMLKVTVARWYTPAGVNISEKGITPDRVVVRSADDINANRDPQLDAALQAF